MTRGRGGWLHLSPYGSFIRYSMSVYPDAFGPSHSRLLRPKPPPFLTPAPSLSIATVCYDSLVH